jgi:DNA polymerase-3 subunit delta
MANNTSTMFEKIMGDLRNRKFSPVYLLEGEETYFIDAISKEIEESVLKPEEKSFNQTIAYGKDVTPLEIKMSARRYPMMSEHQVLIIKEAQNLSSLDVFEDYLENPMQTTILVFCYKGKKIDKRKKVGKLFSKYVHFTSDRMRDYEVTPWIESYLKKRGRHIDPKAVQMIADYLGSDLSKICNEIDKMLINVKEDVPIINVTHIEQNIGISKDFNIFELQKSLGQKNFNKSVQIANYFAEHSKQNPIIPMISQLFTYFGKVYMFHGIRNKSKKEISIVLGVHEFFVDDYAQAAKNYSTHQLEQIFAFLKYYDLRSKGVDDVGTEDGQLLIELIIRILRIAEIPSNYRIA